MKTIPIVSALCREPEGTVIRNVYPMQLSIENLRTFWERTKHFRTVFTSEVNGDFKKFCEIFISHDENGIRAHGLFWRIDDFVGVYYMTHINEVEATVHYTFFDRRHTGREELTREMLRYVFRKFGFRRLNVEIPMYASKNTFGFVNALGFKKEGRKRKASPEYKGEIFDVALFGLLRDDLLKEEVWEQDRNTRKQAADQQQDSPTTLSISFDRDLTPDLSEVPPLFSDSTEQTPWVRQGESLVSSIQSSPLEQVTSVDHSQT